MQFPRLLPRRVRGVAADLRAAEPAHAHGLRGVGGGKVDVPVGHTFNRCHDLRLSRALEPIAASTASVKVPAMHDEAGTARDFKARMRSCMAGNRHHAYAAAEVNNFFMAA